jgi:hypothetical protein
MSTQDLLALALPLAITCDVESIIAKKNCHHALALISA